MRPGEDRPGADRSPASDARPPDAGAPTEASGRRHTAAAGEGDRDRYRAFVTSEAYRRQRPEKARVIARICGDEIRRSGRVADFGAGTGLVKKELEAIVSNPIVGFELDRSFMEVEKRMAVADVTRLPVEDGGLDFAVLNHLYEHVADQAGLFRELHRALRAGGGAYVSAGSRWAVMEPHYRLPFLSWLPRRLADAYLHLTGRGESYRGIRFRGYGPLTRMMREAGFRVDDRTVAAVDDLIGDTWGPAWRRLWSAVRLLPDAVLQWLVRTVSPQWFFLLRKPGGGRAGDGGAGKAGAGGTRS